MAYNVNMKKHLQTTFMSHISELNMIFNKKLLQVPVCWEKIDGPSYKLFQLDERTRFLGIMHTNELGIIQPVTQ